MLEETVLGQKLKGQEIRTGVSCAAAEETRSWASNLLYVSGDISAPHRR